MHDSHISWTPLETLQQWSHTIAPVELKPPNADETAPPRSSVSPDTTYVPIDPTTTRRKPRRRFTKRSIFLVILAISIILGLIAAVVVESKSVRTHKEPAAPASPPPPPPPPRPTYTGIATFNDYASQGNTVCGPKTANTTGYYGAAAGDISPNISGGRCSGSINMSLCINVNPSLVPSANSTKTATNITITHNTTTPYPGYNGPSCPRTNCGLCYQVATTGYLGVNLGSTGRNITVQIIDSCPASNAFNYCKANAPDSFPADQRCGDPSTNQLDIDVGGYEALTGQGFTSGSPNLEIGITPVEC